MGRRVGREDPDEQSVEDHVDPTETLGDEFEDFGAGGGGATGPPGGIESTLGGEGGGGSYPSPQSLSPPLGRPFGILEPISASASPVINPGVHLPPP